MGRPSIRRVTRRLATAGTVFKRLGAVAIDRMAWAVGAGLGSGLAPVAPATAGSLVAVVIYFFAPIPEDSPALYALSALDSWLVFGPLGV